MKHSIFCVLALGAMMVVGCQTTSNPEGKAEEKANRAENRVDYHTDRAIDKSVDKALEGMF